MCPRKVPLWLLFALGIAGCAVPQKQAKIINIEASGTSAVTYPTELRAAYFFNKGDTTYYCAEPFPDVALDTLEKISAELSAKLPKGIDAKGKLSTELSAKIVQLAGRTELILLAREMLYRACELTINHPDQADEALRMYMRVAELVENLSSAERMQAEAELLRVSFGEDKYSNCIRDWLKQKGKNLNKLKEWLGEKKLKISMAIFVSGKDYAEKREQFVLENSIPCDTE